MNTNDVLFDYFKQERKDFNLNEIINDAKDKFNNYYDVKSIKQTKNFESDLWTFSERFYSGTFHFDFKLFLPLLSFNKNIEKTEFILALKVWTINNLSITSPATSYKNFSNILSIVHFTHGLNSNFKELEDLIYNSQIYSKLYSKSQIYTKKVVQSITSKRYINSFLSFASFYPEHNVNTATINNLHQAANSLKIINISRSLPHPKDILNFKDCIEDFYSKEIDIKNNDTSRLIKFFPLILWWEITSIIPMRPSEFCSINYDCVKDEKLVFPRFKQSRKAENSRKNIEYDMLPIPIRIIEKIQNYKSLVKEFGNSEQLISFPAHLNYGIDNMKSGVEYSNKKFSAKYLNDLINKFYKEVVVDNYKLKYEAIIKPGDLRHIAIISMMVQGYDRVQIERLAGHYELNTHYSYTDHMQYWVDTEIQTLCTQFSMQKIGDFISPYATEYFNKLNQQAFVNEMVNSTENGAKIDLEVGHCKDEDMLCPTFNWDYTGCYHCKNWGISSNEITEKKDLIISELSNIYNDLKRKVVYLGGLYNLHELHKVEKINPSLQTQINIAHNEIQEGKNLVVKLSNLLGVEKAE